MQKDYRLFLLFALVLVVGILALTLPDALVRRKTEQAKQHIIDNSNVRYERGDSVVVDKDAEEYQLVKTSGYSIVYQKKFDLFIISITGTPFAQIKEQAEQDFLALTESSPQTACRLKVKISTPLYANPEFAGKNFPLSFCGK
ncbi:MAG: hypothetical protein HYV78_00965 [Candidatus Wildermuthbacteria bacterium]|nr:hypothetical protein [Candidatus Wildermuthbacteria bacterium]